MAFGDNKSTSKFNLGSIVGNETVTDKTPNTLDISKLKPYNNGNQPFKMYDESKMADLVESIRTNGQLQPVIVRTMPSGEYEILAGHNRVEACRILNQNDVKAIVLDNISDAQAQLIVVDTNLCQRQKLLPSERARAYKIQQEALAAMGVKSATSQVAEMYGENRKTVQRYVSLNKLDATLLEKLDNDELTLNDAVSLSTLSAQAQTAVADYADSNKISSKVVATVIDNKETVKRADDISILMLKPPLEAEKKNITLKLSEFEDITDLNPDEYGDFLYFALQHKDLMQEYNGYRLIEQRKNEIADILLRGWAHNALDVYKKSETTNDFVKNILSQHRNSSIGCIDFEAFAGSGTLAIKFNMKDNPYCFSKSLVLTSAAKRVAILIENGKWDEKTPVNTQIERKLKEWEQQDNVQTQENDDEFEL